MMKKLNNKGMTLIEVVTCMAIVSAIVVSMFNVILAYQNEEVMEAIRSDVIEYRNIVTKTLQDDIIRHSLKSVNLVSRTDTGNGSEYIYTLTFNQPFGSYYDKTLIVSANDVNPNSNYIMYQDYTGSTLQPVKYVLPNYNCSGTDCNITKFTSINTNFNKSNTDPNAINLGYVYFNLDIAISNPSMGSDYHIKIAAPLDYMFCRVNPF